MHNYVNSSSVFVDVGGSASHVWRPLTSIVFFFSFIFFISFCIFQTLPFFFSTLLSREWASPLYTRRPPAVRHSGQPSACLLSRISSSLQFESFVHICFLFPFSKHFANRIKLQYIVRASWSVERIFKGKIPPKTHIYRERPIYETRRIDFAHNIT